MNFSRGVEQLGHSFTLPSSKMDILQRYVYTSNAFVFVQHYNCTSRSIRGFYGFSQLLQANKLIIHHHPRISRNYKISYADTVY